MDIRKSEEVFTHSYKMRRIENLIESISMEYMKYIDSYIDTKSSYEQMSYRSDNYFTKLMISRELENDLRYLLAKNMPSDDISPIFEMYCYGLIFPNIPDLRKGYCGDIDQYGIHEYTDMKMHNCVFSCANRSSFMQFRLRNTFPNIKVVTKEDYFGNI